MVKVEDLIADAVRGPISEKQVSDCSATLGIGRSELFN